MVWEVQQHSLPPMPVKLGPSCESCPYRDRPGPVPSDPGREGTRIFLIGEAPGWEEVRQGAGFVGGAGRELWDLAAAVGLHRVECAVGNLVKCLPAGAERGDYTLDPAAISACAVHLESEVKAWMAPGKVIVPVGAVPLRALMGMTSIRRFRGAMLEALPFWRR